MGSVPGSEDRHVREGTPTPSDPPPTNLSSTPLKPKNYAERLFSTLTCYRHPTLNKTGKKMLNCIVGPMPVEDFLQSFLPTSRISEYCSTASRFEEGVSFKRTVQVNGEMDIYKPFVSDISSRCKVLFLRWILYSIRSKMFGHLPRTSRSSILIVEVRRKAGITSRSNRMFVFITSHLTAPSHRAVICPSLICISSSSG